MGYVLGSDTETMTFTDLGVDLAPAGLAHAVDLASPLNSAGGVLAYAACGKAVRVWPERAFDPAASGAHAECVSEVRADPRLARST
jgi:hypothetical protein